ncbi:uncharacterized protein LACBIDRAFT_292403 [Laccaria bicolor S238N-H82]|uniref:Predicted protein n=1 Tax=Laccaria bicolor (strain S238N-H82 / ATCC MYA-4686) TaxID=486041 RepID=B0CWU0_LACBS|nr:uncharacterized protein LACBIDRAFT_292403 [Laccaria bicolor S238N-H82]EDR13129.1 predicted protein [Laccaria bicolor S238N-H82]|eukprot:XP_001875627.1 predicted protein [Laccaria bicolor S238N-H82]
MGLRPYSHVSASSSRTNDEKSGTRATEPSQRREGYTKRAPVSTLDQRKLSPTDWLDLSGVIQPSISFRHKLNGNREWRTCYHKSSGERLPFPPPSSGFFYYHQPPGAPLLSGELRFRLTSNHLPESFNQGEDCLTPEGDAWKIPLFLLYRNPFHRNVYQQLRVDGFVSDALDSKLKSIAQTYVCSRRRGSIILHSLHQVFPVDFSATTKFRFFVVGDSTFQSVSISYPFQMGVEEHGRVSSYTSKGLTMTLLCPNWVVLDGIVLSLFLYIYQLPGTEAEAPASDAHFSHFRLLGCSGYCNNSGRRSLISTTTLTTAKLTPLNNEGDGSEEGTFQLPLPELSVGFWFDDLQQDVNGDVHDYKKTEGDPIKIEQNKFPGFLTNHQVDRGFDSHPGLVLGSPVPRLQKDHNWTRPRLQKTRPAVLVFQI